MRQPATDLPDSLTDRQEAIFLLHNKFYKLQLNLQLMS